MSLRLQEILAEGSIPLIHPVELRNVLLNLLVDQIALDNIEIS